MAEEQKTGCSPSDCAGCSHAGECGSKPQSLIKPENKKSHINHVIAVVSGKGGVGKSMVTASLARLMREQGFSVGIMDADITGPSIPKMYGIHEKAKGDGENIFPCEAKDGTKIMSINLLLPEEDDPVIWRGPVISGVVTQFWTDVAWGELDYLFVPVPSGRRHRDRNFSAGSGTHDRKESLQHGRTDGYPGTRNRGELQLSEMSGLRT